MDLRHAPHGSSRSLARTLHKPTDTVLAHDSIMLAGSRAPHAHNMTSKLCLRRMA